ncbi:hypothetical protein GOP47_0019016 [Adiantum capillus-veneris]|uniref:Uncharacterized protein n=1 Tax=Adiantum capillus-veneris TaxID=13818 RepID=A0A9D4UET4_ADICA|nr:hypothetical protein GOP47_0019016 [Adiantum capillus-veneris]
MGRAHMCCQKQKLRKGLWSPEEDEKLISFIAKHGHGCWSSLPKQAGLQRCGKSCRLRWINYLRPDLKRGMFSPSEEKLIFDLHAILGNRARRNILVKYLSVRWVGALSQLHSVAYCIDHEYWGMNVNQLDEEVVDNFDHVVE